MEKITWIFVLFVWIHTFHPVSGIGCKTRADKFKDSIDLAMVTQDKPEDGEEVPVTMAMTSNDTGDFLIERVSVSASSHQESYFKMTSTGNMEEREMLELPEPVPPGPRRVRKFKQVWKGVDVFAHGGVYDAVTREPIMTNIADCIHRDLKNGKPRLDIKVATRIVSREMRTRFLPTISDRNSKLYVYVNPKNNKAVLIWYLNGVVEVPRKKKFSNAVAIVDANSGKILFLNEYLESYGMTGDGGNIKIGKHRYGEGAYKDKVLYVQGCADCPKCISSNPFVEITSANHTQYYWEPERCFSQNKPYEEKCDPPSPNADATNMSFSQVHDALYFATTFREMLRDQYRDLTLDKCSKSGQIKICVHYDSRNMAVFKDIGNCEIYFGFGFGEFLDPAAASTVAHELGHALNKVTSNLEYSCQSGGMAEAFADICAVTFNAYIHNKNIDWGIGREIVLNNGTRTAVRYMNDPPTDGHSIGCTRDYAWDQPCTSSILQDPHRVAGIYNKAFFNLVTIQKWDIMKAFEIFLRASKFYWKSNEDFDGGLCGLIEATIDIYSGDGKDAAFQRATEVSQAFAKVGVICGVTKGKRKNVANDKKGKSASSIKVKHSTGCPKDWVTLSNFTDEKGAKLTTCYKIEKEAKTWEEAAEHCESLDAHLAIIDTADKTEWVSSQLPKKKAHWVGGTDRKNEGKWRWTKPFDIPISWTGWRKKEPLGGEEENCLALIKLSKKTFGWNDEKCQQKKPFICEISCCGLQCRKT